MFKLTRPCSNCPFRRGQAKLFDFAPERLREIVEAPAFQCHKTVYYSGDEPSPDTRPQQCAGLMAMLNRMGRPNQIMQVASRLGHLDLNTLDPDGEAYDSIDEMQREVEEAFR